MALTLKQNRFIQEYARDGNGTQAAIRAGYSAKTAYAQASQLLANATIQAALKERLTLLAMPAEEAIKRLSDIARSRLNDYLLIVPVLKPTTIRKPLTVLMDELKMEIAIELQVGLRVAFTPEQQAEHEAEQWRRRLQLFRYEAELSINATAYRDVPGPMEWVNEVRFDWPKLMQAKEEGLIKRLRIGRYGPSIEFYPADVALTLILKLHGCFSTHHDHNAEGRTFEHFLMNTSRLTEEENALLLDLAIKVVP